MTQENKKLLIKDLCSRLPYGVKIELTWWVMGEGTYINTTLEPDHIEQLLNDEDGDTEIKPYLFPLSSMTEEQKEELFFNYIHNDIDFDDFTDYFLAGELWHDICVSIYDLPSLIDWLNKNHFDYRGLIKKGLAIDATELNIY